MQAYNQEDLDSKEIQEQSSEAFYAGCIGAETYAAILQAHPYRLYTPNYFIRIALGLLTLVIGVMAMAFIGVLILSANGSERSFITISIIAAIGCYIVLERFVKEKRTYNAGIDNLLMAAVPACILSAICIDGDIGLTACSFVTMLVCGWLTLRFTDAFMAMCTYISLLVFIYGLLHLLHVSLIVIPFFMAAVSVMIYLPVRNLLAKALAGHYTFCCQVVAALTLLSGYICVNYLVVREWFLAGKIWTEGTEYLYLDLHKSPFSPLVTGLLWTLTMAVPLVFIANGIKKKSLLFIRTGICLVVASILTFRNFYHVLPAETMMILAGAFLIIGSYLLTRYLSVPKGGFTFAGDEPANKTALKEAEAAILTQIGGAKKVPVTPSFTFGGGSTGGGGATGNY